MAHYSLSFGSRWENSVKREIASGRCTSASGVIGAAFVI